MTFNFNILPNQRSLQVFWSVWEISSRCWPASATEDKPSSSRGWLRRFLLLKLATVLLFPHSACLPLLVGCVFSLRVLLLLRSPHISTKPSAVFLAQLALADGLVLMLGILQLGLTLIPAGSGISLGPMKEAVNLLCQQLLDAHHLASLLLLGLLGLEATLVSRWPLQTRRFRTSRWAQMQSEA
ncbi:uncharacterized protein V6R79_008535 [Siganus canaliculatus]